MIAQWQTATSAQRENFLSDIGLYPELVWESAKTSTYICGTIVTQTCGAVCQTLGTNWQDWKSCRYATEAAYKKQIARVKERFLLQVNLRMC